MNVLKPTHQTPGLIFQDIKRLLPFTKDGDQQIFIRFPCRDLNSADAGKINAEEPGITVFHVSGGIKPVIAGTGEFSRTIWFLRTVTSR